MCSVDARCYLFRLDEDPGYNQGTEDSDLVVQKHTRLEKAVPAKQQ